MGITITVKTEDGVERAIGLHVVDEVDFGQRGIINIDLTPLRNSTELRELNLYGNHLQTIDLEPLSSCSNLQRIVLRNNKFREIDLGPLGSCPQLEVISVSENNLKELDLKPLSSSSRLNYFAAADNELERIDLSPFNSCTNLRELFLHRNRLRKIDLVPLGGCKNLEGLYLYGNRFRDIDLSVLRGTPTIQNLQINENQLKEVDLECVRGSNLRKLFLRHNLYEEIDLRPLSSCPNLRQLDLSNNNLQEIDLSPLIHCTNLQQLSIADNRFPEVDLSPLVKHTSLDGGVFDVNFMASSMSLKRINILFSKDSYWHLWYGVGDVYYDVPVRFNDIEVISHVLPVVAEKEPKWKAHHLFQNALDLLGFSWCGILDLDPESSLRGILARPDPTKIIDTMVFILSKQIDRGGTTIGLDVSVMMDYEELAVRKDKVIKMRDDELRTVDIGLSESTLNLRSLLLTAHGNQMLTALGIGTTCNQETFEKVETAAADIGFKLRVTEGAIEDRIKVPKPLVEYIWAVADYKAETKRGPSN